MEVTTLHLFWKASFSAFDVKEIYYIHSHSQAQVVEGALLQYAACISKHVLFVFYSLYFFVGFACPNIFFILALFYNLMKELLQASSKNEIFSEACPEVRPDGILRILTERPQWEATGLDKRWGRPNERKN